LFSHKILRQPILTRYRRQSLGIAPHSRPRREVLAGSKDMKNVAPAARDPRWKIRDRRTSMSRHPKKNVELFN
jgi:hypothetical protein